MLTLAVAFVAGRPAGGRQAAVGLVLGCGLSVGLQLVLGTWDALWRDGWSGWVVAVVLAVGVVGTARGLAAFTTRRRPSRPAGPAGSGSLGPFLALAAMIVANPAFVASQSGLALGRAGSCSSPRTSSARWSCCGPPRGRRRARGWPPRSSSPASACALWLTDFCALVAVAVLEVSVGIVLAAALSAHRPAPRGIPRTASATLAVGVLTIAPLLLYMLDYDVPLPRRQRLGRRPRRDRARPVRPAPPHPRSVPALTSPDRLPRR